MSELRFENSGSRWLRYGLLVLCITALVFMVLTRRWGLLLSVTGVSLGCTSLWINAYTRTMVTRERITVQQGWRQREIPASQVVAVTQRTAWSPVIAELVSGETVVLPRVEASDLVPIIRLIHPEEPG